MTLAIALVVVAPESIPGIRARLSILAGILRQYQRQPRPGCGRGAEIGRAIQEITVMTSGTTSRY